MSEPEPDRGLTVKQLLILLIVSGVLLSFVAAWLDHQRELARRANCSSNLQSLALSIAMYADLYDEQCPYAASGSVWDSINLLTNVTSSGKIFYCPSDKHRTPKGPFSAGDALTRENISYGYVAGLVWQSNPDSILIFERGLTGPTKGSQWRPDSPHGTAGGNQLFLDGHVEFKPTLIQDLEGGSVDLNP